MDKKKKASPKRDKFGRFLPTHGAFSGTKLPEVSAALGKWREALIKDLGGEENISASAMLIIENAIDIKGILLAMINYIRRYSSVVSKGRLNPILSANFLAYANSLQRHLCALGLERKMFDDSPQLVDVVQDIINKRKKADEGEEDGRD
jgi:hypothetical protein